MKLTPFPTPESFSGKFKLSTSQQLEGLTTKLVEILNSSWDGKNAVVIDLPASEALQRSLRERVRKCNWVTSPANKAGAFLMDAAEVPRSQLGLYGIPTPEELKASLAKKLAREIKTQGEYVRKALKRFDGTSVELDLANPKMHPFTLEILCQELAQAGWSNQRNCVSPEQGVCSLTIHPNPNKAVLSEIT